VVNKGTFTASELTFRRTVLAKDAACGHSWPSIRLMTRRAQVPGWPA